jgi:hypothetical protein
MFWPFVFISSIHSVQIVDSVLPYGPVEGIGVGLAFVIKPGR